MTEPAHTAVSAQPDPAREDLLADVRAGLTKRQKELDPKYFYDERGSALFEKITGLPEYYLTRAERALLESEVAGILAEVRPRSVVELGAGSAAKTRVILDSVTSDGAVHQYVPVDVSGAFLAETADSLMRDYPRLRVHPAVCDFSRELALPPLSAPALFLFLGSTIGNFEDPAAVAILQRIASRMTDPRHRFLLGVDLRKDVALIEAAYNDSAGVTADFNRNILSVLNRRLGADFNLPAFRHRAFYNRELHRIEMHLVAEGEQLVNIPEIGVIRFGDGESVRTEVSCKYDRESVGRLFADAGLAVERWIAGPGDGPLFALALGRRNGLED